MRARDDLGSVVAIPAAVASIVSLVPSLTEAVASCAPDVLAGATKYCSHPPGLSVERVGGTKNPDVARIIEIAPDVVLANEEENRQADLAALRAAGIAVWVTRVRTLPEALTSLDRMITVACRLPRPAWLDAAESAWADGPAWERPRRAVIPIWRRPWMVLVRESGADLVILPDEPYRFTADDGPEAFPGIPAALVSGRHLTWYGPSLVQAPAVLARELRGELSEGADPDAE